MTVEIRQPEDPRTFVNLTHPWRRDGGCKLHLTVKAERRELPGPYVTVQDGIARVTTGISWAPDKVEVLDEQGNPSGFVFGHQDLEVIRILENDRILWVNPAFR